MICFGTSLQQDLQQTHARRPGTGACSLDFEANAATGAAPRHQFNKLGTNITHGAPTWPQEH